MLKRCSAAYLGKGIESFYLKIGACLHTSTFISWMQALPSSSKALIIENGLLYKKNVPENGFFFYKIGLPNVLLVKSDRFYV